MKMIIISICLILLGCLIAHCIEPRQEQEPIIVVEESPIPHEHLGEFTLSFYTHTGNRTKTGVYPKANRTVAADPKIIPLNSYIYIEGWGVYHVEDVGGKIINNRLDIFLDKREDCIKNGIKKAKVYLLTTNK